MKSFVSTLWLALSPAGTTGAEYGMSAKLPDVTAFEIRSLLSPSTFTTSWSYGPVAFQPN